MIDIHTHILPELDDGSSSVEESINMLGLLSAQGVGTVVATPHFYIDAMEPKTFLNMRDKAVQRLKAAVHDCAQRPDIAVGAEFQFYSDIHKLDCIEDFCISGTKYILIEMPFDTWPEHTFQVLEEIYTGRNITPIIAHVERYIDFQRNSRFIHKLKEAHCLVQINSIFLTDKTTRRKALRMVKKGLVNFIASDTHNTTNRPPILKDAFNAVNEKFGEMGVASIEFWSEKLLANIETF